MDAWLIPISALQHYSYCPRQCALIHQEQSFEDNLFTLRGQRAHRRVDSGETSFENGRRILRALPLYSEKLGLIGKADVVEILPDGTPYPVEYKQGHRHQKIHDDLQLAAQALCLEEMFNCSVPEGAIFHHQSQRRRIVPITPVLREQVIETTRAVRKLLRAQAIPPPTEDSARCRHCSLYDICQPDLLRAENRLSTLVGKLYHPDDEES